MKKSLMLGTLSVIAGLSFVALNAGGIVSANDYTERGNSVDREAIHAAIEAGDYTALPEAAQERITMEKFTQMQAHNAEKAAHLAELEEVVANNDFNEFVALAEEKKADKEANKAEKLAELESSDPDKAAKIQERMADRTETTDEEKQVKMEEKFSELTTYYTENGELPEMKKEGKKRGNGMGMRGNKGGEATGENSGERGMRGGLSK